MTSSISRRYLALWFPTLGSDRWRRAQPAPPEEAPICIIARVRQARRVVAGCALASAQGLVGLALADARARVPGLIAADDDPHADAALLDALAELCLAATPVVCPDPPDGLILDIAGCEHLWGGEAAMADALTARVARAGVGVRHALAGAPDAARALARFAAGPAPDEAGAVRRLPVEALELEAEATTALRRAGLRTLGDLTARPLAGLAARFGAEAVTAVRRLTGEAPRALVPHRPPPAIRAARRFAEPINTADAALGVVHALAAEMAEELARRGLGARRFEARLFRADGHVAELAADTSMPTRDPALLRRLLAERVEALRDPLDPGFGYDAVTLCVPVAEPLADTQLRLDGGTLAEAQLAALADRLAARLGPRRVRRLAVGDSHVPERAQLVLALGEIAPLAGPQPMEGEPPERPITLLEPPEPVEVIAEVPDGPPHRFRWRRAMHLVARFEGPERIAPEWWRRRDGTLSGGRTRDYYRVEDTSGRRYWLFRHGLYDEAGAPGWYLHGLFA